MASLRVVAGKADMDWTGLLDKAKGDPSTLFEDEAVDALATCSASELAMFYTKVQQDRPRGLSMRDLRSVIDRARKAIDPTAQHQGEESSDSRKVIELDEKRINAIARQCVRLLFDQIYLRGIVPTVIVRAGEMATPDEDGNTTIAGVQHDRGSLIFAEPSPDRLMFRLDELSLFKSFDARSQSLVDKSCPRSLGTRIIGAAAELGFRQCAGIVALPLFQDGLIISENGYHAGTGNILNLGFEPHPVPDEPSDHKIAAALQTIRRPFRGYVDHLSDNIDANGRSVRAVLDASIVAAVLTAVARPSLPTSPGVLVDANYPGAGKGLMARSLSAISIAASPSTITEGHSREELEKRLASAVVSGAPVLLLDNLQRTLMSSTLESILTEGTASIRDFGSLSTINTRCSALVIITANQASLRADMLRRLLTVRIIVDTDQPELRTFDFDPVQEALADRREIIRAALTIFRAWWQRRGTDEGRRIRKTRLGSFEAWSDLVAGAVEWLTQINPIVLIEEKKAQDAKAAETCC